MSSAVTLETIVAFCKRRGFVYPAAEIYGGINGIYDFGPLGSLLRHNIKEAWRKSVSSFPEDVVFIEGSLLGPEAMWKASGHLDNFSDPMIDCTNCKKRYRADDADINFEKGCPNCGKKAWTGVRQFQMMFKTELGALEESAHVAYLRPETAQAIFVNFKNIMSTSRVKMPFGAAQVGKAFRNEITPKQFLFRMREFEQMELEFFCHESESDKFFDAWTSRRFDFLKSLGIRENKLRLRKHEQDELSHYARACIDVEYEFPFGWKELEGIAHRSSFDLTQHAQHSKKDLAVFDEETKQSYTPNVVECSIGVDRLFLTLLFDAYYEDVVEGESRAVLRLSPQLAPIKAAVLPLTKHQSEAAHKLYADLKREFQHIQFDLSGSIGKRYRRQDEIGTPVCFTYDYESDNDGAVTARSRDTLKQERIPLDQVANYLRALLT
jgi:glycyl-tRNA synthetase